MPHASPVGPQAVRSLFVSAHPRGLVVLVRAAGSSEVRARQERAAMDLQRASFTALLLDPLTREELIEDPGSQFDVDLLTARVVAALSEVAKVPAIAGLPVGCWGSGAAAAAALAAAGERPELVAAVVSCGGRPDLLGGATLASVRAPVLLLVGEADREVIALNHFAMAHLQRAELHVIPHAMRLLYDARAFETALRLAVTFFDRQFAPVASSPLAR